MNSPLQAELSGSTELDEPRAGYIAQFKLTDGRRVDVVMPNAVSVEVDECRADRLRIQVVRPDRTVSAELTAVDLVEVFGARLAADVLAAWRDGDLPRARRLAERTSGPWRELATLLGAVETDPAVCTDCWADVVNLGRVARGKRMRRQRYDPPTYRFDDDGVPPVYAAYIKPWVDRVVASERAGFLLALLKLRGIVVDFWPGLKISRCRDVELLLAWIKLSFTARTIDDVLSLAWCATGDD